MLSVNELLDSPFETPLDTHEETFESSTNSKSKLLNVQQKKGLRISFNKHWADFMFI